MENSYIKSLVTPRPVTKAVRRVKAVDVEVWRLFAVAELAKGEIDTSMVSYEDIGCPIRLATNKDGTVRFSQSGMPSTRIARGLVSFGTMVHNNFVSAIVAETESVFKTLESQCNRILEASYKAGKPIADYDQQKLADAMKARAEAEAKAPAENVAPAPEPEKALVAA